MAAAPAARGDPRGRQVGARRVGRDVGRAGREGGRSVFGSEENFLDPVGQPGAAFGARWVFFNSPKGITWAWIQTIAAILSGQRQNNVLYVALPFP